MLKNLAKYNMKCNYNKHIEKREEEDKEHEHGEHREHGEHDEQHEEYQYLNLIHDILEHGRIERGRNGFTKSIFGASMVFSLRDGKIPILTTKRTAWKTCFKELLWFIRGDTSNEKLRNQGVHIWDGNASRQFLDSRGLYDKKEGDLGPVYGHQWRHFNAPYVDCDTDYSGKGIDQLQQIINVLKNHDPIVRTSRRLVLSAWNPCQLDEMALPPCHVLMQFNVSDCNKLSCALYQRSGDVGLGVPFNIASYSALTHIIAKHAGLEADEFVYHLGNAHIYEEHMDALREQLSRKPYEFARIEIDETNENREKIENYRIEDIKLIDYKSHEMIPMKMIA
jgi:thymidylate synthase